VGTACLGRHDFEQAEHLFQAWISEAPADADAWCMLGYSYVQRGFAQKAEFVVRQLRKLPGGEAFACAIQSEVYKSQRNWLSAREQLERAVAIAPQLLMPRAMLVDLLMAMGAGVDECRQAVVEFLRLAPQNTAALQMLERLSASPTPSLSSRVTVAAGYNLAI
jgi:tetratricopeptide (TPR) repeat protein